MSSAAHHNEVPFSTENSQDYNWPPMNTTERRFGSASQSGLCYASLRFPTVGAITEQCEAIEKAKSKDGAVEKVETKTVKCLKPGPKAADVPEVRLYFFRTERLCYESPPIHCQIRLGAIRFSQG